MRKLILLVGFWAATGPSAAAKPYVMFRPAAPNQSCCNACTACDSCDSGCSACDAPVAGKIRPRTARRHESGWGQNACCPADECCRDCPEGEKCQKERKCLKVIKWFCYLPTRTRCDKQPQPCCVPPLYLFFTCCQPPCAAPLAPPCGCAPAVGGGTSAGCQSCR